VLRIWSQEPNSQHFSFFVTYKCGSQARVIQFTKPERLATDKHSSVLDPLTSFKGNEVLLIYLQARSFCAQARGRAPLCPPRPSTGERGVQNSGGDHDRPQGQRRRHLQRKVHGGVQRRRKP
jgi:hypothetical protein